MYDSQPNERLVIGIDPGLASLGYGIVAFREGRLVYVTHGCIVTSPGQASGDRLLHIHKELTSILELFKPTQGGMEDLYFFRNVSSALPVSEAKGVIKLAFRMASVELSEFSPNEIKKAVTGTARADKVQVQEMVKMLLGLDAIPSPDHAADALAAAICRIHASGPLSGRFGMAQ
jgi:crossover junction endodeoxyribonuclease RuvC